jgi:hypothetical protein
LVVVIVRRRRKTYEKMENSQERYEALLAKQNVSLQEMKALVRYTARLINYLEFLLELENSIKIPVIELDSSYSPKSKELQ